jgi:hypothetical protein
MGTGCPFPGEKSGRSVTLTSHRIYCQGLEWEATYSLLLGAYMAVVGQFYFNAVYNPLSSAGFKPSKLGSNGKFAVTG